MPIQIINQQQAQNKIRRIAFQIIERNFLAQRLTLVGIFERGFYIANLLEYYLKEIAQIPVRTYAFHPNQAVEPFQPAIEKSDFYNQKVIIVDDVLYTGATLLKTLIKTFELQPSAIQIATLIDRGHRKYPISPDYVGIELATTFHEFVRVELTNNPLHIAAYLE
jgi:pyrimidine operon attenuation protein/uracil phosphoribosyltransferase